MIYFGPFAFETISVEGRVVKYNKGFHNREDMERFCSRLKDFGIGEISVVSGDRKSVV